MSKPSSLTSIIVDLGFSAEQEVGEVQARQVIYGGDQETILLELGIVNEAELLQALATATGLPAAEEGYLPIDAALTERLPGESAELVAGYNEAGLPRVYGSERPDEETMKQLAELLGDEFELLAAPRLRIAEALACMDRGKLSVRESGLLDKLGARPPNAPLRAAPETPVEDDAETAVPPEVRQSPTAIVPPPRSSDAPEIQDSPASPHRPLGAQLAPLEHSPSTPVVETAPPPVGYEEMAAASLHPPPPAKKAQNNPPPRQSYSIAEATADLQGAKSRDRAIDVLVHYAAQFFEYTAVFAVLSKEAKGLRSTGRGAPTETVKTLKIPLDLPSLFKEARQSSAPRVAKLKASGLEGGVARDLDRPTGRELFLLPIGVRGRAVLLLWGDRGTDHVTLDSVSELISFAPIVSQTLERVLIEHKRASRVAQAADHPRPSPTPAREAPAPESPAPAGPTDRAARRPLVSADTPKTQRNPAAPAAQPPNKGEAPAPETPHEVATAHKRTLSQPTTPDERSGGDSEPPMAFPAEAPRTLRGYPETRPRNEVSQGFEERKVERAPKKPSAQPPLLSRRIVPLGEIAEVPAPEPPRVEEVEVPAAPVVEVRDLNDDDEPPQHSSRGTLMSRRPRISEPAETGWESPTAPEVSEVRTAGEPAGSPGGQSCAELVQLLIHGDTSVIGRLVDGGDTAVGALISAFPGPVSEPENAQTLASACGPVLEALVALKDKATPFLTVRTADSDPVVRRWATFLLGELPGKDSARAIAGRLLDDSIEVRRAALISARRARGDVLTRRTLRSQVEDLCRDKSLAIESRCSAVEALADIREHEAIPTLLQLLDDKDGSLVRATRWALSVLTRQDFGTDNQAWRNFWQEHRDQDRIEWLIASLDHEQRDLRRAAGEELKALSGRDFGFNEDLSNAERRNAQAAFRDWWAEEGKAASL